MYADADKSRTNYFTKKWTFIQVFLAVGFVVRLHLNWFLFPIQSEPSCVPAHTWRGVALWLTQLTLSRENPGSNPFEAWAISFTSRCPSSFMNEYLASDSGGYVNE